MNSSRDGARLTSSLTFEDEACLCVVHLCVLELTGD